MKQLILFRWNNKVQVMQKEEFKLQPFYTPDRFGEVEIVDFTYSYTQEDEASYKRNKLKIYQNAKKNQCNSRPGKTLPNDQPETQG